MITSRAEGNGLSIGFSAVSGRVTVEVECLPEFGYSVVGLDEARTAKASLREVDMSPKEARELAAEIKGMRLQHAKDYLQAVAEKRASVPFRRYKGKVGHRRGQMGVAAGRYPVKCARLVTKLLDSLEANASFKGLDAERLMIVHASATPGRKVLKFMPRAMGRSTPWTRQLVHFEVAAEER